MKLIALVSGGKDSWYSLYLMMQMGHEIACAVTFIPKNKESYMLQSAMSQNVSSQFAALNKPIRHKVFGVSGEKEIEVEEMKSLIAPIVREERIEGLVCGALGSEYQKQRVDFICEELGINSYAPLWRKNEEMLLREMVLEAGFEFMIAESGSEAADDWRSKIINRGNVDAFIESLKKGRCNISGEGGEYETYVTKCPLFKAKPEA
jgi:asparagine synthase (glutamine-hydrolysing)